MSSSNDVWPLDVRPVTSFAGADIHGIDLGAEVSERVVESLRATVDRRRVVFLHGQSTTPELWVNARRIADLDLSHALAPEADIGTEAQPMHIWASHEPAPPELVFAVCVDSPAVQTDVRWADLGAAHDRLSPALQRWVGGLSAVHQGASGCAEHPLVRVDEIDGTRSLFVSPRSTVRIVGMSARESRMLLSILIAQVTQSAFEVRVRWQMGTVVFWNNTLAAHGVVRPLATRPV